MIYFSPGYYRVNYEKNHWLVLAEVLRKTHEKIHVLNRAQLVNDVFSLARSIQKDYIDYSTAFTLSSYLKGEKSYVVWNTALRAFEFMMSKLSHDEVLDKRLKVPYPKILFGINIYMCKNYYYYYLMSVELIFFRITSWI